MELTEYVRKTFPVNAVKVTFENIKEVSEWCGGVLDKQSTRMLGTETDLPVIKIKGVGENRSKEYTATLGCYVVELNGSYRVYREPAFFATFEECKTAKVDCKNDPAEDEGDDTDDVIDPENIELRHAG